MPNYICECCKFTSVIKTKYVSHCETTKHKRLIEENNKIQAEKSTETSLSEQVTSLANKIISLEQLNHQQSIKLNELEQAIIEMKSKVQPVSVQPVSVQPVKQVKQVKPVQPVQPVPESKPERITEKFLTDNYTTTIDEFLNQIIFEEEEVHELMKNPFPDKLMLKKLKETVENTDISHRGFVTTDTARKKMWILHKNKWEVSSTASMYIKRTLRKEISKMLCNMTVDENGDLLDMNENDTDTYMNMVVRLSTNDEWEQIDTSIMELFSSE
jgi:hypothetical protein